MSKYNYPNWHEIKDLVMIYNEPEWDNAEVVVWDPAQKKHFNLVFCGSAKEDEGPNKIHFIISEKEETK